jgi:hypothetical protein
VVTCQQIYREEIYCTSIAERNEHILFVFRKSWWFLDNYTKGMLWENFQTFHRQSAMQSRTESWQTKLSKAIVDIRLPTYRMMHFFNVVLYWSITSNIILNNWSLNFRLYNIIYWMFSNIFTFNIKFWLFAKTNNCSCSYYKGIVHLVFIISFTIMLTELTWSVHSMILQSWYVATFKFEIGTILICCKSELASLLT